MSDVHKHYFEGEWLLIDYKGFFNRRSAAINVQHITTVGWFRSIKKVWFLLGITGIFIGFMSIMADLSYSGYYYYTSSYRSIAIIAFLLGVGCIVLSFILGKRSFIICTDDGKEYKLKGAVEESGLHDIMEEIATVKNNSLTSTAMNPAYSPTPTRSYTRGPYYPPSP